MIIICKHSGLHIMSYIATFSTWENHQSWRSRCIQQVPYSCSIFTGTISYKYTRLETITAQLKLLLVYINLMAHLFKALSGILGRVLGREQVCVKQGICYIVELLFIHSVVSDSLQAMDCSTPGFPVLYHLPELVQTHVHCVSDAIQPSHPLSSPSPHAFNLS